MELAEGASVPMRCNFDGLEAKYAINVHEFLTEMCAVRDLQGIFRDRKEGKGKHQIYKHSQLIDTHSG
jgi:hypothetical protein